MTPPAVRLFRIEHPVDGLGPFQSFDLAGCDRPHLSDCTPRGTYFRDVDITGETHPLAMPLPEYSPCLRQGALPPFVRWDDTPHLKFAFPSLRALLQWMPPWAVADLEEKGFVIRVVACPWKDHTRWKEQVRYDSNRATVLRTMQPINLLQ